MQDGGLTAGVEPCPTRGLPSGEHFAELVRQRADSHGDQLVVEVEEHLPGCYGVSIDWSGHSDGLLCEVADGSDRIRVLDPDDESFTVEGALTHIFRRVRSTIEPEVGGRVQPRQQVGRQRP
jgi:hypothetical protein